jgi:hypothetical protein
MKPKYNIGDKVTIKSFEYYKSLNGKLIKKYGLSFSNVMSIYCNKTFTIDCIKENDLNVCWYGLKGIGFTWVEDFFVEKFTDNIYVEE